MTQLAGTLASVGGKMAGHAIKGSGAKSAGGADFASFASAAGLPTDADATGDADAATPYADDAETKDSEKGKSGRKGDDALVLDLSLNAAAQSAVADPVVTQPQSVAAAQAPKDESSAIALDGATAPRPFWQSATESVARTATPVVTDPATAAPAEANIAAAAPASVAAPTPAPASATKGIAIPAAMLAKATPAAVAQKAADQTPTQDAVVAQTVTQDVAVAIDPAVAKAKTPAVATARAEKTDKSAQQEAAAPSEPTDAPAAPPIFAALPQAIVLPRQAQGQTPAAAAASTPQTSNDAVDPAMAAAVQLAANDSPVATPATGARPVMSALHRTVAAHADAAQQTAVTPAAERSGSDAKQDKSKDGDAGAATLNRGDGAASSADASAASSQPFSDILQSLPPLAQSRIGLTTDASPVVTGPGDVGATLQGQVIDMGVGGQWIDRMAKEITALADGNGHSRFQLNPPNLGKIQIDVWHGENGGEVKLMTETDEAAQRLRAGKAGLEADARMSALSLNSITIEKAAAGAFGGNADQGSPQQQTPQRHQSADQGFGQQGSQQNAQTGAQGDAQGNRWANQAGTQGNAQNGSQSQQNNGGQGKGPFNRDVLKESAGTTGQDGGSLRRDGDRVVRYA